MANTWFLEVVAEGIDFEGDNTTEPEEDKGGSGNTTPGSKPFTFCGHIPASKQAFNRQDLHFRIRNAEVNFGVYFNDVIERLGQIKNGLNSFYSWVNNEMKIFSTRFFK